MSDCCRGVSLVTGTTFRFLSDSSLLSPLQVIETLLFSTFVSWKAFFPLVRDDSNCTYTYITGDSSSHLFPRIAWSQIYIKWWRRCSSVHVRNTEAKCKGRMLIISRKHELLKPYFSFCLGQLGSAKQQQLPYYLWHTL